MASPTLPPEHNNQSLAALADRIRDAFHECEAEARLHKAGHFKWSVDQPKPKLQRDRLRSAVMVTVLLVSTNIFTILLVSFMLGTGPWR